MANEFQCGLVFAHDKLDRGIALNHIAEIAQFTIQLDGNGFFSK